MAFQIRKIDFTLRCLFFAIIFLNLNRILSFGSNKYGRTTIEYKILLYFINISNELKYF